MPGARCQVSGRSALSSSCAPARSCASSILDLDGGNSLRSNSIGAPSPTRQTLDAAPISALGARPTSVRSQHSVASSFITRNQTMQTKPVGRCTLRAIAARRRRVSPQGRWTPCTTVTKPNMKRADHDPLVNEVVVAIPNQQPAGLPCSRQPGVPCLHNTPTNSKTACLLVARWLVQAPQELAGPGTSEPCSNPRRRLRRMQWWSLSGRI